MKKIIKNCLLYLLVVLILLNVLLFKESRAIKGLIFISSIVAFLTSIPCVFFVNKLLKIEIKNSILKYFIYFLLIPFVLLFVFGFGFTFLLSIIVGLIFTFFRFDVWWFLKLFIRLQTNPNRCTYEKEFLLFIRVACIIWDVFTHRSQCCQGRCS